MEAKMAGPNWHLADDRKTVTVSFPSDPPVDLKLESRGTRGLLGKLFGKGSVAALVLAVFLISGTAWALQPGEYQIFGYGTQSCGSWTAAKEKNNVDRVAFRSWVNGYLTAYSRWVEKDYRGSVASSDPDGAGNYVLERTRRPPYIQYQGVTP